jgi:type I restriction enzyme S subunit
MKKGWEMKPLGEICKIVGGGTPSKKNEKYYNGNIPWATVRDMSQELLSSTEHQITKEGLDESSSNLIGRGNVIIATRVGLGKVCIIQQDTAINQDLKALIPVNEKLEIEFLFNWYKSIANFVVANGKGMTVKGVRLDFVNNLPIPIPPLPEQKAIVKILDEAFAKIDQAKANIEKNIENAKELFQSKLNEIFSHPSTSSGRDGGKGDTQSLPKGWEEKKFKEVCVLQRGFDLPKRLRNKGEFSLVTSSGITDTHNEFKVKAPGVVTGRSGSIGKVFFVEDNFWPLNTSLYIKEFHSNLERYVYYFLKAFDLSRYSSGAGVPTLNRNLVHDEIILSTSNKEEQHEIVEKLDKLALQTDNATESYTSKLILLDELKKSLLQKAFSGELTKNV